MINYLVVSTVIFAYLFVIWSTVSNFDKFHKLGCFILAAWGAFEILTALGWVVKLPVG